MRHRGPGIGETVEVAGATPPDARVLIDEHVPEDGAAAEEVDGGRILERRLAVPAQISWNSSFDCERWVVSGRPLSRAWAIASGIVDSVHVSVWPG